MRGGGAEHGVPGLMTYREELGACPVVPGFEHPRTLAHDDSDGRARRDSSGPRWTFSTQDHAVPDIAKAGISLIFAGTERSIGG